MTDVDRLLEKYIEEFRAGGDADPAPYLRQVEGVDRAELRELIDGFLTRAPRREWDPEAYRGSRAEAVVESLSPALRGVSGLWPSVLPDLRERAKIKRPDLVAGLARALGVTDKEEKVALYYHQMEQGALPARGVSDRVLDALGGILDQSAETLRRAGETMSGPGAADADQAVFARKALLDKEHFADELAVAERPAPTGEGEREWDEVDELFRGG